MLWCIGEHETSMVLVQVHKGACISLIGRKTLSHKLLRAEYYKSTLMKDIIFFFKKWNQCQRNDDLHHAPTELLQSMKAPWPFYQWDILVLLPLVSGQLDFLIILSGQRGKLSTKSRQKEFVASICRKLYAGLGFLEPLSPITRPSSLALCSQTFVEI